MIIKYMNGSLATALVNTILRSVLNTRVVYVCIYFPPCLFSTGRKIWSWRGGAQYPPLIRHNMKCSNAVSP